MLARSFRRGRQESLRHIENSVAEFDDSSAGAALVLGSLVKLRNVGMAAQKIGDRLLEHAHAMPVNDADAAGGGHHSAVEELIDGVAGFLGELAYDVQLLVDRRKFGGGAESDIFR